MHEGWRYIQPYRQRISPQVLGLNTSSLAPPDYILPLNIFSLLYSGWNSLICFRLLWQDHAGPTSEQRALPRAPPTNQ